MEKEIKQDLKALIADLAFSNLHGKMSALHELMNWVNNHDRGKAKEEEHD